MLTNRKIIGELALSTSKMCEKIVYSKDDEFRKFLALIDFGATQLKSNSVSFSYDEDSTSICEGIIIVGKTQKDIEDIDRLKGFETEIFEDTPFHIDFQHIDNKTRKILIK